MISKIPQPNLRRKRFAQLFSEVAEVAGESQPPITERLLSSNALRQQRFRERQAALRNVTEPLQVTDVTGGNGGERAP
jgi:hypothetical protein